MNRIFGTTKPKEPKPTLNDIISQVSHLYLFILTDTRSGSIESKIKKLDAELFKYREQMSKMRDGPGKNAVKQRALRILQQKKMYESQVDQLMKQSFSMEQSIHFIHFLQAIIATENLKGTMASLEAMKSANKELKQQYGKIDVSKIELLQDEMQDLLEQADEVQEIMGRSYATEDIDQDDLEAELEALGDDLLFESDSAEPSYLDEAPASVVAEFPSISQVDPTNPIQNPKKDLSANIHI